MTAPVVACRSTGDPLKSFVRLAATMRHLFLCTLLCIPPLLQPKAWHSLQICEGMIHIHEVGNILHRDLEPENLSQGNRFGVRSAQSVRRILHYCNQSTPNDPQTELRIRLKD